MAVVTVNGSQVISTSSVDHLAGFRAVLIQHPDYEEVEWTPGSPVLPWKFRMGDSHLIFVKLYGSGSNEKYSIVVRNRADTAELPDGTENTIVCTGIDGNTTKFMMEYNADSGYIVNIEKPLVKRLFAWTKDVDGKMWLLNSYLHYADDDVNYTINQGFSCTLKTLGADKILTIPAWVSEYGTYRVSETLRPKNVYWCSDLQDTPYRAYFYQEHIVRLGQFALLRLPA